MVEKQCQGEIKDEPWASDQVIQIINTTMGIVVSCDQSGVSGHGQPTLPLMPASNTLQGSSLACNPRDRLDPCTRDLQQPCGRHSMRQ